ncbi:MAG: hypothetical protein PHU85_16180, partial [Phycisphaerae bacterium]|nr:hypothetical protein [Phycisphaerae bacterium]
ISGRNRPAAAITMVLLAVVGCTTLLWGHLPARLTTTASRADRAILWTIRYANPLLAANDAVSPPTQFDWPHHGWMYRHYGIIGESRLLGQPNWACATMLYLVVAAIAGAASLTIGSRVSCPPQGATARSPSGRG